MVIIITCIFGRYNKNYCNHMWSSPIILEPRYKNLIFDFRSGSNCNCGLFLFEPMSDYTVKTSLKSWKYCHTTEIKMICLSIIHFQSEILSSNQKSCLIYFFLNQNGNHKSSQQFSVCRDYPAGTGNS